MIFEIITSFWKAVDHNNYQCYMSQTIESQSGVWSSFHPGTTVSGYAVSPQRDQFF